MKDRNYYEFGNFHYSNYKAILIQNQFIAYDVAAHDGLFEAGRQYQEQKDLAQKKRLSDLSHTTDETKKIVID